MSDTPLSTFIIDCPKCKAKVAAHEYGRITSSGGMDYESGELDYGTSVALGKCPRCYSTLVGESQQTAIGGYESEEDQWADVVRVYPDPPKMFRSPRIPRGVSDSIAEGMRCLQANANMAACLMFGRALEALCRDLLAPIANPTKTTSVATQTSPSRKPIMLGDGIRGLRENGLIDQRLFDWSEQLHVFRNLAAHPTDEPISREDAEDLQSFASAIVEYIYDLTDRYNEFKARMADRESKKRRKIKLPLRLDPHQISDDESVSSWTTDPIDV